MIAPARRAAIEALRLIDDGALDLGAAVARLRESLIDTRDHALLLELVAGTLRMRAALDYQLAARLTRPLDRLDAEVLRVLRLSAFQILYLSRLPPSAVIDDAVDLTRLARKSSASGLTNAVLRALARDRDTLSWPARAELLDHLSTVHSHPKWLVSRWLERYGEADTEAWLRFNNTPAQLCLAVNLQRTSREELSAALSEEGVTTSPTARAVTGLTVLSGRPLPTRAFARGLFVVQDEASQLIAALAVPRQGSRVLDLCASPGGKTLALSAAVAEGGFVTACDVRSGRVELLARTLARAAVRNAGVVHIAPDGPLPFRERAFETVLVDAPCSGLGTVRRDPDIRWRRQPDDLPRFAAAQRALLDRAAALVAPGGTLVYATCSSEPEENDAVVAGFTAAHGAFAQARTHRTLPHRDGLEAFFGAVLLRAL